MNNAPWVGIDLDGTLAYFDGTLDPIGKPIPAMVHVARSLIAQGLRVKIFTARACATCDCRTPATHEATCRTREARRECRDIESWCVENLGRKLEVTNEKDFGMLYCIDDRAVSCEANTGRLLVPLPEVE